MKNAADQSFLNEMLAHHQTALVMAGKVLKAGSDAKVRALAAAIVKTQTVEIATMESLGAKAGSTHREHASVLELRDRLTPRST